MRGTRRPGQDTHSENIEVDAGLLIEGTAMSRVGGLALGMNGPVVIY